MHKHRMATKAKPKAPLILKEFKSFKPQASDVSLVIREFYTALDCPESLMCLLLYENEQYDDLVSLEFDPMRYECTERARKAMSAISFLRKSKFLKTSFDKESVALKKFQETEDKCRETNFRFGAGFSSLSGRNVTRLNALRRKISRILSDYSVSEHFDLCAWGPGSTTHTKGSNTSASRKFSDDRGTNSSTYHLFWSSLKAAFPLWELSEPSMIEHCKLITVAKNAKTDRTIAVEPGINSFLQHGAGKLIGRRLRSFGYDLRSDLKNRTGALIGSRDNSLATVDFSSASDTIARNLVREILPERWFLVLDALRSDRYLLKNAVSTVPYSKFSSMGNGYTFELESLIFLASALVITEELGLSTKDVSVFGDDIIIPSDAFASYSEFVEFLGFTVNTKKSYSSSYFRESCGSYYFRGVDIKPYFLKRIINNAQGFYILANSIRLLAHRYCFSSGCDSRFLPVWNYIVRRIPSLLRLKGSARSADSCIHVNFDECCPSKAPNGWEGYTHPALLTLGLTSVDESHGHLLARLSAIRSDFSGNRVSLRRRTKTRYTKRLFVYSWYNFGPWMHGPG